MPRIAFLTLYPVETASTRQRVHKNIRFFPPDLQAEVFPGITTAAVRMVVGGGRWRRLCFLLGEVGRKLVHIWQARRFDVIVLQKGLTVMNLRGFPSLLFALGKPVVFDFDDAVYLEAPQAIRSRWLRFLVAPRQVMEMMPRFSAVVAGNRHLGEVARSVNPNTVVIGTPMDIDWYRRRSPRRSGRTVIGWSGSTTTNHYVRRLQGIITEVHRRTPTIEFRVISNDQRGIDWTAFGAVPCTFVAWSLERLVEDLLEIDIGVMPLDDDEWSRSKCGGKVLQYMACGIPSVASPVGINTDVIRDGVTGYLASADDVWIERLIELSRDPELRERMGVAARSTIEREHSNQVTSAQLRAVLGRVIAGEPLHPPALTATVGAERNK